LFVVIYFRYSRNVVFRYASLVNAYTHTDEAFYIFYLLDIYSEFVSGVLVHYNIACAVFSDRKAVLRFFFVNKVENFLIIDLICITCKMYEIEPV